MVLVRDFFSFCNNCSIVPLGFLQWEFWIAFPRESQLRQSRSTQPMVHAGCFSVSIIHRTLTWTTGSLTCAQVLMHAIAHGGCPDTRKRVCTEKVDSERENKLCRTGESNLRQRRDGPMLYQLNYIPIQVTGHLSTTAKLTVSCQFW